MLHQTSFFDQLDASLVQPPWMGDRQAGVDEVGIGPLAGPVVAAAVLLDPARKVDGLADSKVLTAKRRSELNQQIKDYALAWSVSYASVAEIDEYNILRASHLAMQRAVQSLQLSPEMIFVDGNKTPHFNVPCVAVVKGDQRIPQISAASVLAKVARDDVMSTLGRCYPQYGFERHMGYPTKQHFQALEKYGPTQMHRLSFAPVRKSMGTHHGVVRKDQAATSVMDLDGILAQSGGWLGNHG